MKGDVYRCPVCKHTIKEADCEYSVALCHRTGACRRSKGGAATMVKEIKES